MHTFDLDLTEQGPGGTPQEQRASILTAIQTTTFVEVAFRDDSGGSNNIYADLVAPEIDEQTGHDESGIMRVVALEKLAGAA